MSRIPRDLQLIEINVGSRILKVSGRSCRWNNCLGGTSWNLQSLILLIPRAEVYHREILDKCKVKAPVIDLVSVVDHSSGKSET